jgi:hypothetical protein
MHSFLIKVEIHSLGCNLLGCNLKNIVFVDWEILNFSKEILFEGVEIAQGGNLDLEDILQCLCAKQNGCTAIITNDSKFFNCGLEIFSVEQFLGI